MAGFAVGVVDEPKIVTGNAIQNGNMLIGLSSSGVHSNGFSLVRKLCFDKLGLKTEDFVEELGMTLGENLITPTKIYVKPILKVLDQVKVLGMVHMTGGGFYENIPRIIPEGLGVDIQLGSWPMLPIFNFIMDKGNVELEEMYGTFNMSIGYILVVDAENVGATLDLLEAEGEAGFVIGKVTDAHEGVTLCK